MRFDEEYIESLLDTQHGEGRCRALLHLLFPEMNVTEVFHIDHLHPKNAFTKKALKQQEFLQDNPELLAFYSNSQHWNSITNLHLLNDSQNISKSDRPLQEWMEDKTVHLTPQALLVEDINLDFSAFQSFYEHRREALKNRLISRVSLSDSLAEEQPEDEADEEVVEDTTL